jgi:hypothetical protein
MRQTFDKVNNNYVLYIHLMNLSYNVVLITKIYGTDFDQLLCIDCLCSILNSFLLSHEFCLGKHQLSFSFLYGYNVIVHI